MRLVDVLHPDPLGSLSAPPDSIAAVGGAYFYKGKGREKGKEGHRKKGREGRRGEEGREGRDDLHPTLCLGLALGVRGHPRS